MAFSALALAQNPPPFECKTTETQAECHARLKCKPDEELEDCKKRLRAAAPKDGTAGQRGDGDRGGGDRGADDRGRDGDADRRGRDRDEDRGARRRDRDRDADRGGERRGRDRGARQRRQRDNGDRGRGFEANKTFGLGIELGEPSGLNGKYFLSDAAALDFGLGWIYRHYYYGDGVHIYADFLFHPISLASTPAFELPLYVGPGLRFWDFDYCFRGVCGYGSSAIGIRVPVGISFDFNNAPLDIFLQLVPVLDFIGDDYRNRVGDRTHFGIDLSVGIRYWFK